MEFALNLPVAYKKQKDVQKYILKEVLYSFLPKELFDRPKWGFAVPMGDWLKGDLSYLIDKYLSVDLLEEAGFVRPEVVQKLISRFHSGEDYIYQRLWMLIVLHKWYSINIR
jgi:asparagine synthase (glutamine-hydrolysing)